MKVVILGAGISGLALGWFLKRRFGDHLALTILEKNTRPGGWIRSIEKEGFLFEEGPRSCRSKGNGIHTLELIESLNLQDEVIAASEEAKQRYLYLNEKLHPVPSSLLSFLFSPLTRPLLGSLCKEWRIPPHSEHDESIYDFISRRFNPGIAQTFIDPLTSGIYAGDIRKLSIRSCFPELYRLEKEHGSIVKGMFNQLFKKQLKNVSTPFVQKMVNTPIFSFKNGMETLVKKLAQNLEDEILLDCEAYELNICQEKITIGTNRGYFDADYVCMALPASAASKLLHPVDANLAEQISHVSSTASVTVVNMGWKANVLSYKGFGYLIPSREKEDLLGVVWDSSAFPQQNRHGEETRLTAMLGGAHHPEIEGLNEEQIIAIVKKCIYRHIHVYSNPTTFHVSIAKQAIPQYCVGHIERLSRIEKKLSERSGRVKLIGSAWNGVGINDCITNAKTEAESIVCKLKRFKGSKR